LQQCANDTATKLQPGLLKKAKEQGGANLLNREESPDVPQSKLLAKTTMTAFRVGLTTEIRTILIFDYQMVLMTMCLKIFY
jgi:hypothetical protein